jgi:hypothetical protein
METDKPIAGRIAFRLTEADVQQLVADYQAGTAAHDLADRHGLARSTVVVMLRKEGVLIRYPKMTPEECARVVELYRSGVAQVEIARHQQRTRPGNQRPARTPARHRTRLSEPHQLHRPITTRNRRLQTPTTPSIMKSPFTTPTSRHVTSRHGYQARLSASGNARCWRVNVGKLLKPLIALLVKTLAGRIKATHAL